MRLIRLKIKNVASLRGEHVVDFEAIAAQSSLFAITGETGAGKSTILTSITTALYGQNHKKLDYADLVTLGEREGEIKLIFQAHGHYYLAEWFARVRGQNGEPLKQIRSQQLIFPLEGREFDSPRGERAESAERLLNLNFEQFCKCIILNQGEFARFLTSTFTHRKEILEKLYDGEALDRLSSLLTEETKEFQRRKSDVELRLSEYQVDPVKGDDLEKERDRLSRELSLQEGWQKRLDTLARTFTSLTSHYDQNVDVRAKLKVLEKELSEATSLQNAALVKLQKAQDDLDELQRRDEKERPRLEELRRLEVELTHKKEAFAERDRLLKEKRLQLAALEQGLTKTETALATWQSAHQKLLQTFHRPVEDLRANRPKYQGAFERFQELQTRGLQLKENDEALKREEARGQELKAGIAKLTEELAAVPSNVTELIQKLQAQKQELQRLREVEIEKSELKKRTEKIKSELAVLLERSEAGRSALVKAEQDLAAVTTTMGLLELAVSIETCLTHADTQGLAACPVCATTTEPSRWRSLLQNLKGADVQATKARCQELTQLVSNLRAQLNTQTESKAQREKELLEIEARINGLPTASPETSAEVLDKEIQRLITLKARGDQQASEKNSKEAELKRARETWAQLHARQQKLAAANTEDEAAIRGLINEDLDRDKAKLLKDDLDRLLTLGNSEASGNNHQQELSFALKEKARLEAELAQLTGEAALLHESITALVTTLKGELGERTAQSLIEARQQELKDLTGKKDAAEVEHGKLNAEIGRCRGRNHELLALLESNDQLFQQCLHEIRREAQVPLPTLSESIDTLVEKLKTIDLNFESPRELYVPFTERLLAETEELKMKSNRLHGDLGSVIQRLAEWEKRQDKIRILELEREELAQKLARHVRLSEVLGKDELRSFVLALVEENLIIQTNEELQKLCQGRYEIIHQSKGKTPEFYILDRYREGGRRKVTTLSGGETFMVSLAMALALAELTRGKAEIDSLFIDEGFGTLDPESLGDVLDMLNQIQTRGLLVGIISHIKALTDSLPVNLLVTKRQDGTSILNLRSN